MSRSTAAGRQGISRNQCDGCMQGLPVVDGLHRTAEDKPFMACTSYRYNTEGRMDIVDKLKNEARREPHEPIWRETIAEIQSLRIQLKQAQAEEETRQRVLKRRDELIGLENAE